jgi:signal transduction histidine kinase
MTEIRPRATQSSDALTFADEAEEIIASTHPWTILVVDDDPAIHQSTQLALRFFSFEGRSLFILSAYSAQEARQLLRAHPDIALILLDVIMETPEAGLGVAQYVRDVLKNPITRIILRTGHPGEVPEESVIVQYDINDYKTKLELTQQKLFTAIISGLRAYRDLVALDQSQQAQAALNGQLQALNQNLEHRVEARTQELSLKNRQLQVEIIERQRTEAALQIYIHALAHDLRNPVIGLNTTFKHWLSQAAAEQSDTIHIPVSLLERLGAGCDRQLSMIESLLEAKQIEVGGVSLQCREVQLPELIQAVLNDLKTSLEKKRVQVVLEFDPNLPAVKGDRDQLWRVFENLIQNAIKYNPPGILLTLGATYSEPLKRVVCTIADTGIGIEPSLQDKLFQPYQRGKLAHAGHGLGLGLYISHQIVAAHGGTLQLNPQTLSGAEFRFDLPIDCSP